MGRGDVAMYDMVKNLRDSEADGKRTACILVRRVFDL